MSNKKRHCLQYLIVLLIVVTQNAYAEIKTQTINYQHDGITMTGYLAFDASLNDQRPGVIVVHEWWGHNDYVQQRARKLAKLGYTAFALDMYGAGKIASHPKDAAKFSGMVMSDLDVAQARFEKALEILKNHNSTDASKIAAIGYCFGGSIVLEMARRGIPLVSVASFHGSLKIYTQPKPGTINTKMLVLNGQADPFVTAKQILNFKKQMNKAKINYELLNYEAAKHSFSNPAATQIGKKFGIALQYNAAADNASWQKMIALFNDTF